MNTNEQTIHQMGLGISSLVKQATGRESVSNIDMDWVSVEQLARYIYGSGSGDVVSFDTNITDGIVSLIAYITAVQDLNGYDNPWPAGGGKNLVNVDDFSASGTDVTLTINGNEVHAVGNGNSTWLNVRIRGGKKTYSAGTYYVKFKIKSGATVTADTKMCLRTVSGSIVRAYTAITSDTLEYSDTWTISEDCCLTLLLNGNTSGSEYATDITVYDLIVSESDVPWEPYSNICPITGWTGANVTRTGKNLIDSNAYITGYSISTSTGKLTADVNSKVSAFVPIISGKRYVFSGKAPTAVIGYRGVYFYDVSGNYISYLPINDGAVFANSLSSFPAGANKMRFTNYKDDTEIQLEIKANGTKTDFEAYQGTTYTITWQTEAGTVYGGTLDVLTGVLTAGWAIFTIPEITEFSGTAGAGNWKYRAGITVDPPQSRNGSVVNVVSEVLKGIAADDRRIAWSVFAGKTTSTLSVYCDSDTTVEYYNANIAGTDVIYRLDTPVTYQLTPQQVSSLIGENNIYGSTGNVSVEYKAKEDLL